ncbi:MAG TPA: DUF805 domain-containing protein [Vitreimonas sp.]|jgi:uncharacterized membrane protein YhaH (DUF805 family)|nr:DUF805 domain-containing protein [Vitreimonas sp.]
MLSLFFSFHGRINRAQYWLGSFMSSFIGFVLIAMIVSVGAGAAMDAAGKGAKFAIASSSMLLALPVLALMSWSGLAIQVKRFHDRGRTGWVAAAPFAVSVLMGFELLTDAVNNTPVVQAVADIGPYSFILWAIGLWFFIDLGCLAGTDGANKFGDPPGAPGSNAPQPIPGAPSSKGFVSVQEAMDRAIAQRDAAPVAAVKRSPAAPRAAAMSDALHPAAAGAPRGFGRRTAR